MRRCANVASDRSAILSAWPLRSLPRSFPPISLRLDDRAARFLIHRRRTLREFARPAKLFKFSNNTPDGGVVARLRIVSVPREGAVSLTQLECRSHTMPRNGADGSGQSSLPVSANQAG